MLTVAEKTVAHITRTVAIIGGSGLLVAIAVTCASIIAKLARRLLNTLPDTVSEQALFSAVRPFLGEEELVQYAVGFALFTALPWLTLQQEHIRVDLLKNTFAPLVNRLLNLIANSLLTGIVYLMLTQQWFLIFRKTRQSDTALITHLCNGDWDAIASRMRLLDESQILGIQLVPLYTVAELCLLLLFIVCLLCVARNLRALLYPPPAAASPPADHE